MTLTVQAVPDEQARVADVRARLQSRFPELDPDIVSEVVDRAYHEFDGANVRDFVPILVEKHARDLLVEQVVR
jgi:hypothetical protein